MSRAETTAMLSKLVEKRLKNQTAFWASEVNSTGTRLMSGEWTMWASNLGTSAANRCQQALKKAASSSTRSSHAWLTSRAATA